LIGAGQQVGAVVEGGDHRRSPRSDPADVDHLLDGLRKAGFE
jgi:hypothetical protein